MNSWSKHSPIISTSILYIPRSQQQLQGYVFGSPSQFYVGKTILLCAYTMVLICWLVSNLQQAIRYSLHKKGGIAHNCISCVHCNLFFFVALCCSWFLQLGPQKNWMNFICSLKALVSSSSSGEEIISSISLLHLLANSLAKKCDLVVDHWTDFELWSWHHKGQELILLVPVVAKSYRKHQRFSLYANCMPCKCRWLVFLVVPHTWAPILL
jgi:hypothetical protein